MGSNSTSRFYFVFISFPTSLRQRGVLKLVPQDGTSLYELWCLGQNRLNYRISIYGVKAMPEINGYLAA